MKIGIDARMLGTGFGIARYVQQLVLHLEKIDTANQYILFLRKENWDEFEPTKPNFKKVLAGIPWYSLAEQIKFPAIIKAEKVDLMHFPHWNVPLFYNEPYVVTIHDLIMYHYKRTEASTHGPMVYWIKDQMHRIILNKAVRTAKKIFVTSEFTKNDLSKTLHVPLEKMIVTYQAPFEKINFTNNVENIRTKYNITKPFVLYVGAAYPHKNLDGLIIAWKIFTEKHGNDYQLVLTGKENYFYKKLVKDFSTTLRFGRNDNNDATDNKDIVYTSMASDAELTALYAHTSLYVFPSFYEGFGLPPLEAMTHDVPVISSSRSCMPEILGNAAEYFDPDNLNEMAETIWRGLTDQNLREKLKTEAKKQIIKYSWDTLAEQTLQIYQSVDKSH